MDSELRALLAALFSIAFGGKFSHEAMEKERGIILAEIENGGYNGGYQTWLEKLLYPTLPLMHCSAAGTEESVGAISLTDIEAHFHRHYRPKNAILIVKSRFPAELVFAAAAAAMPDFRAFGRGPRLTRGCIFPNVVEETYKSPQTTERLLWVFRRQPDSHIDRKFGLALDVLCSSPFGGVFASLRNRQSLIYSTSEISRGFPVASTEMVILANQTKFKAIEMAFQQEVEKIISGRIGQEALRCVLGRRRRYYIERRENPDGLMCNLRYQWLEDGRIYDSSDGEKAVLSTTLEDVAEAAAQFMVPGNFSLIRHMRT